MCIFLGYKVYESKLEIADYKIKFENIIKIQKSSQYSENEMEIELSNLNKNPQVIAPTYQNLYKELYSTYPENFVDQSQNTVYLTFDDGPSQVTDEILAILALKEVKATFFITGAQLENEQNRERLIQIAEEGHSIGIHTYSHDYKTIYTSVENYLEDFYKAWTKVEEVTGIKAEIFRFPGGSINAYNGGIFQEIISEMTRRGFVYYDWNASFNSAFTARTPKQDLVIEAARSSQPFYMIVLLHDSTSNINVVKALPEIIEHYTAENYAFKPLSNNVKPIVFGYK